MNQPSRVIYLPPGVLPPPAAAQPIPVSTGVPFDRVFFEQVLPGAIAGFCKQVGCKVPVVELTTVDAMTHYVNGISGVSDAWVALTTSRPDHQHLVEVFIPYQTIFRVEIHPESDERRAHLGFVAVPARIPEVVPAIEAPAAKSRATAKRPAASKGT